MFLIKLYTDDIYVVFILNFRCSNCHEYENSIKHLFRLDALAKFFVRFFLTFLTV